MHYSTVRLCQGMGYVTTDDEHEGRGRAIRKASYDDIHKHVPSASDTNRTHKPPDPRNQPINRRTLSQVRHTSRRTPKSC